ncbi:MAG: hypothetical protein IPK53_11045 [bacterium]|nr:hypothetical protein [bacterium]
MKRMGGILDIITPNNEPISTPASIVVVTLSKSMPLTSKFLSFLFYHHVLEPSLALAGVIMVALPGQFFAMKAKRIACFIAG